jgi:hypothetical protein
MNNFTKEFAAFIAAYLLLISVVFWWVLLVFLLSPIQVPVTLASIFCKAFKGWAYHIFIGEDQMVNTLHGGNMDTHVSGRVGFHAQRGSSIAAHMERPINLLFWAIKRQENHCRASIEHDEIYHLRMGR